MMDASDGNNDSPRLASYTLNMSVASPAPVDPATQARVQAAFRLGWGIEEVVVRVRQLPSGTDEEAPFPEFPSDLAHFRDAETALALLRADMRREEQALLSPMPLTDGVAPPFPSAEPVVGITAKVDALLQNQPAAPTPEQRVEIMAAIWEAARAWDRRAVEVMLDPAWEHSAETTKLLSAYEVGKALCLTVRSIWWAQRGLAVAPAVAAGAASGSPDPDAAVNEAWKQMFTGRRVEQIQRHLEALAPLLKPDVAAVVSKSLAHWRAALIGLGEIVNAPPDPSGRAAGSSSNPPPTKRPSEWPRPHGLTEVDIDGLAGAADAHAREALYAALVEQADNWYDLLSGRRTMDSFSISGSITKLLIDELPNLGAFLGAGLGHLEATVAQAGSDLGASIEATVTREAATFRTSLRRLGIGTVATIAGVIILTFLGIIGLTQAGTPASTGVLAALGASFAGIASAVGTAVAGIVAFAGVQSRTGIVERARQEATDLEDRIRTTVHGAVAHIMPQAQQTQAQASQDLATVRASVQSATDAVAAAIARTESQTKLDPELQALRDDVIAIRKSLTAHVDAVAQAESQGAAALQALTAEAQKLPLAVEELEGKLRFVERHAAAAGGQVEAYTQLQPVLATIEGHLKSLVSKGEGFLGQLEHGAILDIEGIVSDSVTYLLATIRLEERIIAVSEPLVRFIMRHNTRRLNHPGETMENFLEVVYPGVQTNLIELRAALRTVIQRSASVRAPSSGQGLLGVSSTVAPGVSPLPRA